METKREIKFKGLTENNEMVVGSLLIYNDISYISKWGFGDDYLRHIEDEFYIVDRKSVGQFTGLKDKNGKEIYEGDILKWIATTGELNGKTYHNQVYWLLYRWRVKGTKNKKTFHSDLTFNMCHNHKVEVIGNIHDKV